MLTVIIPCCNRISLRDTLKSLERDKDPVNAIVIGDGHCPISKEICDKMGTPPKLNIKYYEIEETGDFGASQRNFAMRLVKTPLMSFLDDDDVYTAQAIDKIFSLAKLDCLNLFKVKLKNDRIVWDKYEVAYGNITTSGIVVPNIPEKLGVWGCRYGTDYDFAYMTYKLMQKKVNFVDFLLAEHKK